MENPRQKAFGHSFSLMSDLPISAPGQETGYRVHLPVFEGPLDLLLHLIESDELDITLVSLARVTGQYLEYLRALENLQIDDLTDFVVVAARLLLIKSQALLPRPAIPSHRKEEDAGEELLRQLIAYRKFKEAARHLEERQKDRLRSYVRLAPRVHVPPGIQHLDAVSMEALLAAARRAMQPRTDAPVVRGEASPFTITIDDQIELISRTLTRQPTVNFVGLLTATYSRQEVAVTLLAVLELIKRRRVQVRQTRMFGEILVLPLS